MGKVKEKDVYTNPNLHVLLNSHLPDHSNSSSAASQVDRNSTISKRNQTDVAPSNLPVDGISSVTFVIVFFLGFLGVLLFYTWKKKGLVYRWPRTYKYSVLNQFEVEPDDDNIADFGQVGRSVMADNDSSDDEDVAFDRRMLNAGDDEFLGQHISSLSNNNSLYANQSSLIFNNNFPVNPATVAIPTQLNGFGGGGGTRKTGSIEDSDEELLQ